MLLAFCNVHDYEARTHPVHEEVERLLRGKVVALQQRPLLLEERIPSANCRCQLELVVRVLLGDDACRQTRAHGRWAATSACAHGRAMYPKPVLQMNNRSRVRCCAGRTVVDEQSAVRLRSAPGNDRVSRAIRPARWGAGWHVTSQHGEGDDNQQLNQDHHLSTASVTSRASLSNFSSACGARQARGVGRSSEGRAHKLVADSHGNGLLHVHQFIATRPTFAVGL